MMTTLETTAVGEFARRFSGRLITPGGGISFRFTRDGSTVTSALTLANQSRPSLDLRNEL